MATWKELYPENYDENGNFVSTGGHTNADKSWNQGYDNSADYYRNQSSGGGSSSGGSNSSSDPATNSDNELPTSSVTRTRDDPTGNDDATVTTTSSGSSSGGPSIPNPGPDTYDDPSDVGSTEEERMIPDGDSGDGNDTFDPVEFDLGNGIEGVVTNQPGTPSSGQNQPNVHPPAPNQGSNGSQNSSGPTGLLAALVAFLSALGSALGSLLGGGN